jgi:hypothetical protein
MLGAPESHFDSQPVASIGAIAVAPSNSEIIYGLRRSRHALFDLHGQRHVQVQRQRKDLANIGLTDSRQIGRILIDPKDLTNFYVAALGHAYGLIPERGVSVE